MPGQPEFPRASADAVPAVTEPAGAVPPGAEAWDELRDGPEPVEPSDAELLGVWPDPFAGWPDGAEAWPADLSVPELDALTRRTVGFEAGGVLDTMRPDAILAGFVGDASAAGLSLLSDDALIGLLCAARRLSSWQAALEFKAVAELDHRRRRGSDITSSRTAAHIHQEVAVALTMTGRSAEAFLSLTRDLTRLPTVLAALSEGIIDRAKARVFATELAPMSDVQARAIAAALWRPAGRMTTAQLRAEIRALIIKSDPDAAAAS